MMNFNYVVEARRWRWSSESWEGYLRWRRVGLEQCWSPEELQLWDSSSWPSVLETGGNGKEP